MKYFLLFLVFITANLFAQTTTPENYFCSDSYESLPTLQNGRVKPLYVHASEALKSLTGKSTYNDSSSVMTYCLLSLNAFGINTLDKIKLNARIDHVDLMKFLNLKDVHYISYENLVAQAESIKLEMRSIKNNDSYQKAIGKLFSNINQYQNIKNGDDWVLAELSNNKIDWIPVYKFFSENKVIEQKKLTPSDPFSAVFLNSKLNYEKIYPNDFKYKLELYYAKAHLASISLTLTLIALATLVLFRNFNVTLSFAIISLMVQLILVTMRVIISGRAPITNMYETVLFSGLGSLLLALTLGHFKKEKLFVYIGLGYNVCTLMMLNFANGMLTATISPLVPVLRDNFWLSTHVTTVMLSYGALALSWILANFVLIKNKFGKISKEEINHYSEIIYTILKWGTTMLALGIILGGVWADYSWGRFWGWDPKETWSLIVLCIYMAILHGRYTSWIKNSQFITYTAGAFLSVMMAWFGVNYILASGLHSYGFSEGGAIFLGSFFVIQTALILLTNKTKHQSNCCNT